MEHWMLAEAIADNDTGGAALKYQGKWYECGHNLWQFAAWPTIQFTVNDEGQVNGLRNGANV